MFGPAVEGRCERWVKWSYGGEAIERRFAALFRDRVANGVVLVEKRRLQRHLRLDPSVAVIEVGPDRWRQRGVDVELAQIRVPGSDCELHWSLAFEAFPGDAETSEWFAQVVRDFLETCPALPLSADRSMSYPRWLLDLHAPVGTSG